MSDHKKVKDAVYDEIDLQRHIAAFRSGKKEAFNSIAEYFFPKLKAIASTILNSEYDAEDAVQEALLKAYNSLDKFRGDSKLSTWLCRIVINQAKSYYRTKYKKNVVLLEDQEWEKTFTELQAVQSNEYEGNDLCAKIMQELNTLPPYAQKVLTMRLRGMTYAEIARDLNRSPGTVKSQIHRAKALLKLKIAEYM